MRKLASVQTITDIQPIEGADFIELASILGWRVVVKKGEFKVGDRVIYCEVDSLMPERPEFEFLRPKKFRIKTQKMKGVISQGICFPLDILPESTRKHGVFNSELGGDIVGLDVTNELGIKKYEPYQESVKQKSKLPKALQQFKKKAGKRFPDFVHKTDETRIQILQKLIDKYRGRTFYVTEKMDGSSFTAFLHNGRFGICSRNYELAKPGDTWFDKFCIKHNVRGKLKKFEFKFSQLPLPRKFIEAVRDKLLGALLELVDIEQGVDPKFWDLAIELDLEKKMRSLNMDNFAIQGEMCGPGIQGNKYNFDKKRLFVFQGYHTDTREYMELSELFLNVEDMGLEMVPVVNGSFVLDHTVDELVKMAEGKSVHNSKTEREGLVYRLPEMETDYNLSDLNAGLVSFKVISPKFLLKNDE